MAAMFLQPVTLAASTVPWIREQLVLPGRSRHLAVREHHQLAAQPVGLVAIVCHEHGRPGESAQHVAKLFLHLPPQVRIERR